MSFKINVSNIGPIITYNDSIYALQDYTDLFDLVEEHPEFVGVMKEHILQTTKEVLAEVVDALEHDIYYSQQRAYAYLQAISAYGSFVHQALPEHQRQIQNLR
jgi:hypothetical protein